MNEVKKLIEQEMELVSRMNNILFDYLVDHHLQFLKLPENVKYIVGKSLMRCIGETITELTRAENYLKEYEAE